ncbi:hypothetical protein F442_07556, partial [Phytophthora nicotianae P10297]
TIVADNGLAECFGGEHGTREKCKLFKRDLKINLTESDVNARVIDYFKCCKTIAEKDPKVLFRLIVDKATELERQYLGLKLQKRETTGRENKSKAKLPQKTKNKLEAPAVKMTAKTDKNKGNARSDSRTKSLCSTKPPPGPCPKCQEMHWLGECPATSESEKEELLKRFGEFLPTADRTVVLNGVLELPYCPDSGSDYTVIGRSHWERLFKLDPEVQEVELEVSVQNQTFGDK